VPEFRCRLTPRSDAKVDVSIDFYVKNDGKVEGIKIINHRAQEDWTTQPWAALRPRTHSHPCHRSSLENGSAFVSLFLQRPAEVSFTITRSFDVRVQSARSPILSFRGGSRSRPVRWSVSGLGCSKSYLRQVLRVRLLYRTFRGSPILQRSSCKRYREVIQTRLKSLSCRQPPLH